VSRNVWSGEDIDITGKDKARILAALYNGCKGCRRKMDTKEAQMLLDQSALKFDMIDGLPVKANLRGDKLWSVLYDQYNGGPGTMRKVLEQAGIL
jgi:hypothetical protein